jgi:hypothetical protein
VPASRPVNIGGRLVELTRWFSRRVATKNYRVEFPSHSLRLPAPDETLIVVFFLVLLTL